MSDSTEPPDWVKANQGRAQAAFNRKAKGIEEPRRPAPQATYEMPGPDGKTVRRQVREQGAIERAKRLEAEKKAAGLEQEAKLKRAGREEESRKAKAAVRRGDERKAGDNAKTFEKGADDRTAQAKEQRDVSKAADRAERLKLAQQFNDRAQYRENDRSR